MTLPWGEDDWLLTVRLHHSQSFEATTFDLQGWPRAPQILPYLSHGEQAFLSHWKGGRGLVQRGEKLQITYISPPGQHQGLLHQGCQFWRFGAPLNKFDLLIFQNWEHHDLLSELSLSTSSRRFPLKYMIVSANMIFINLYYLEAMIISIHCVQNIQIYILLFCTCPQYKLAETFDAGLSIRCLPGSVIGCLILQGQLIHQQRWAWQIHYLKWRLIHLTARALWTNID